MRGSSNTSRGWLLPLDFRTVWLLGSDKLDLDATVLGTTFSRLVVSHWLLLALALGVDAVLLDTLADQVGLHRFRTTHRQLVVVSVRTDRIRVANSDDDLQVDAAEFGDDLIQLCLALRLQNRLVEVEERIKNASQEPTYLMSDVRIIMTFKCFNMNTHKLEQLLHTFFGKACLSIDIFDKNGNRHTPREWFIAPLTIIEQAINYITTGDIIYYKYDSTNEIIIER